MATVADVIIGELQDAGVRTLFGVPGGAGNLDLIEAAGKAGLRFVLTATETGAAIAAAAQAEVTGRLGACLTTLGPGATSVVNGVACAFLERAPVLVFTDSGKSEHQRIDQAGLFAPITNASIRITPDTARSVMTEALQRAHSPRPGPVHIECPGDVCSQNAGSKDPASEEIRSPRSLSPETGSSHPASGEMRSPRSLSSEAGSSAFAKASADRRSLGGGWSDPAYRSCRKPLLLIGLGARRPEDAEAIRALCERHHLPAMVTYKAKGVVPDDHPWFAGVFTNGTIEDALLDEADLLIGIGLDPVELLPREWRHKQPTVYAGPWKVEDAHVSFSEQFVAPVPECVARLEATLSTSTWDATTIRQFVDEQRRAVSIAASGLTAQRVIELAAARFARTARVTVDAGAHMFPATTLWPISHPNDMLISNGLSTMGFAVPAAIGAATVDAAGTVVALTGDGGLLMCAGELLTAVREKLRIVFVVFSDASLSLIEIKQQARRLQPAGVALGTIDWCALAGSFGVTPFAAATEEELERALESASLCEGPCLIEATVDRSNYGATLRALRG